MNLTRTQTAALRHLFRFWIALRRILPKQKCRSFGVPKSENERLIEKIYVINLDRQPARWSEIVKELRRLLDSSGSELFNLADRYVAIDGRGFTRDPQKDADIDPVYSLRDQLYVEPQPLVLPTRWELDAPIQMSRAEVAVAQSHINVWRKIAKGEHRYVLILEDDVWFHPQFAKSLDAAWTDIMAESGKNNRFDVLYVSYVEVKNGAPKTWLSPNLFSPERGLWHLSGYVISREGAARLLRLLPCRGPVDLWINHKFGILDICATKRSIISQRRDTGSTNLYSILPALTKIGAITSEGASLFHIRPTEKPVFAFGPTNSGHSSLAMALSMLGYRCCSDLETLPAPEQDRLLAGESDRVFDAYVNIGTLYTNIEALRLSYPSAKFILTSRTGHAMEAAALEIMRSLDGADIVVLQLEATNKWQIICEHLKCAPPTCSFPTITDLGQRALSDQCDDGSRTKASGKSRDDKSPWVAECRSWWHGINPVPQMEDENSTETTRTIVAMDSLDKRHWLLRSDTFTDNLALFRPSNVEFRPGIGATLFVKKELLGVRKFSAASVCSREHYLYGRFEAMIQASDNPGTITGFFLHRNSPRQEIDIEIAGNRPDRLLVNVFYNPGDEGANFDYGYRGTPKYIDLGFDASKSVHRYAIEWRPHEICWFVDERLVHRRGIWDPTPIPHLPMSLHVNIWPPRSTQLAGRLKPCELPANTLVESLFIEARAVGPRSNSPIHGASVEV